MNCGVEKQHLATLIKWRTGVQITLPLPKKGGSMDRNIKDLWVVILAITAVLFTFGGTICWILYQIS